MTKTHGFYIYEVGKIFMINKDKYWVLTTFELMQLCFEGLNNGQNLTILSFVLNAGWKYFT